MKYFKNTELAKLYKVSEKSVRNWIEAAQNGKIELQLSEHNGKYFIANTSKNTAIIEKLVERGKKYKNTRGFKIVTPTDEFYRLYNPRQIVDIMSNIDVHREIPVQYTYFDGGARNWDAYTHSLLKQSTPNFLLNTIDLLRVNQEYIDTLIGDRKVNIVDLGTGNALPIRALLEHLLERGVLNRYIGIDISREMLTIAEQNINTWFDGKVPFEGHVRDIVYDRFDDLFVDDAFVSDNEPIFNIILFFGGTLNNLREPDRVLETIHDSMGKNDVLVVSKKLDTIKARRYFDPAASGNYDFELVLKLLNVDKSFYESEQYFNPETMTRELRAKFKVAVSLQFTLHGRNRTLEINKDDSILLWRAQHLTMAETINQFDSNGLELLHATRSRDQEYLLSISKVKTNN